MIHFMAASADAIAKSFLAKEYCGELELNAISEFNIKR